MLETVRQLGYLQLDPISTVAPPQHLVLWSRLGNGYDQAELDRLLWNERQLIEWHAFLWPAEDLPLLRARMRRSLNQNASDWLAAHRPFRRYVLRELEQRGPLLSREIETHGSRRGKERHNWWGARQMGLMLEILAARGEVAVVGRRGGQRVWDLGERWYPQTERLSLRQAELLISEKHFRALGVRIEKGKLQVHPEASDGSVPDRVTFLSPFDRLIHDRARTEALFGFFYRLEMYVPKGKREYGYYVLPILRGDRLVGRLDAQLDRKAARLVVNNVWAEPGEPYDDWMTRAAAKELASWLRAELGRWPRVRRASG